MLDAEYLKTLPWEITADTALDALAHCVEGYLILDSLAAEMCAEQAFTYFASYKKSLIGRSFTEDELELMLYTSTLGGIVISMAGTSAVHTIGYPLTVIAIFRMAVPVRLRLANTSAVLADDVDRRKNRQNVRSASGGWR